MDSSVSVSLRTESQCACSHEQHKLQNTALVSVVSMSQSGHSSVGSADISSGGVELVIDRMRWRSPGAVALGLPAALAWVRHCLMASFAVSSCMFLAASRSDMLLFIAVKCTSRNLPSAGPFTSSLDVV